MFYHLFAYLEETFNLPGAGVFQYISFRAAAAVITSLLISLVFGKQLINLLIKKQVGETIRELGLEGQSEKKGTPTMGGLIILGAILIPTVLFAKLDNIYVLLMIFTTIWLGLIGFLDDYIKVFKKSKKGLAGKFKIIGQITLGLVIGATMYFNDSIVIRKKVSDEQLVEVSKEGEIENITEPSTRFTMESVKSFKTTIPFFKNNEADYSNILWFLGEGYEKWAFILFIIIVNTASIIPTIINRSTIFGSG